MLQSTRKILIAAAASLSLMSCEEHLTTLDSSKEVGYIVLANNDIVSPQGYDGSRHHAIGVIFHVSGDTAYAVCARECQAAPFSLSGVSVDGISKSTSDMKGFENTVAIITSGKARSEAVDEILALRDPAWYLPSAGELRALSMSLPAVERSMAAIGGDPFANDYYLSSTEDGSSASSSDMYCYCVSVRNGYTASTMKSEPHLVRAFMRFK